MFAPCLSFPSCHLVYANCVAPPSGFLRFMQSSVRARCCGVRADHLQYLPEVGPFGPGQARKSLVMTASRAHSSLTQLCTIGANGNSGISEDLPTPAMRVYEYSWFIRAFSKLSSGTARLSTRALRVPRRLETHGGDPVVRAGATDERACGAGMWDDAPASYPDLHAPLSLMKQVSSDRVGRPR